MSAQVDKRRAAISLGIAFIALVFLLETSIAHRISPSPWSPWAWALLGAMAVGGILGWSWFRHRAHRAGG